MKTSKKMMGAVILAQTLASINESMEKCFVPRLHTTTKKEGYHFRSKGKNKIKRSNKGK